MKLLLLLLLATTTVDKPLNVDKIKVAAPYSTSRLTIVGTDHQTLLSCQEDGWKVNNCQLADIKRLDEVVQIVLDTIHNMEEENDRCGEFGLWIRDKQGKIMGRYKNHPCPPQEEK